MVNASGMKRFNANLLHKQRREVPTKVLANVSEDPTFIKRSITADETGVNEYDITTVQQCSECRSKNDPNLKRKICWRH